MLKLNALCYALCPATRSVETPTALLWDDCRTSAARSGVGCGSAPARLWLGAGAGPPLCSAVRCFCQSFKARNATHEPCRAARRHADTRSLAAQSRTAVQGGPSRSAQLPGLGARSGRGRSAVSAQLLRAPALRPLPWERRDRLRDAAQPARGSAVPVPAARRAAEQPGGTEVRAGQKRGELGAAGRAGREHRFCGRRAAGAACLEGQMGIATAE